MNRTEFVSALQEYRHNPPNWASSGSFARNLEKYIENLGPTPGEDRRDWDKSFLPQIIMMMMYDQRRQRKSHVTDIQDSYEMFKRADERYHSSSLLLDVTGSDLIPEIVDKVLRADHHVITAKFLQFAQEIYDRGGLRQRIIDTVNNGRPMMTGTFGTTRLTSLVSGGRIMLTLHQKDAEGYDVGLISFVIDEDDKLGITGGLSSQYADALIALNMIDDVMTNWAKRSRYFKASKALASA
jgi:hypothetical protein